MNTRSINKGMRGKSNVIKRNVKKVWGARYTLDARYLPKDTVYMSQPDITLPDMITFIALALQMGHDLKDTLHDYWSRLRQPHTPFYGETMTRDRFLHIRFLHFADDSQRPDQGEEYDRLWKLWTI
jgi:hypothetical protein